MTDSRTVSARPSPVRIPGHVFEAFRITPSQAAEATPLGAAWDHGAACGDVVISRARSASTAGWFGKLGEGFSIPGVRLARPLRTTDGRHVISGFRARAYEPGGRARRVDEMVGAALRLADGLREVPVPEWVYGTAVDPGDGNHVFRVSDEAAWSSDPAPILARMLDSDATAARHQVEALTTAATLHATIRPIDAPDQLGHADMWGTTLFDGAAAPLVTDVVPVRRPHGYTAALAIVDGLVADAVDAAVISRWSHIPHLSDLLVRAVLYRLYVHALHPDARSNMTARLIAISQLVASPSAQGTSS